MSCRDVLRSHVSRGSPIALLAPIFHRAEGAVLCFRSVWSGDECTVLDANQNAGCTIFGHVAPVVIDVIHRLLAARPPLRLPLARDAAEEEELAAALLNLSGLGSDYYAIVGLHSGAEAVDQALALALCVPRPIDWQPALTPPTAIKKTAPPLMLILLEGSFHGNCTHAAFNASAVFRMRSRRDTLCEFEVVYLRGDADSTEVEAAFAMHDSGIASVFAVIIETQQHFSRFATLRPHTAAALQEAAQRRAVPIFVDEIWSGVYRTGSFLSSTAPMVAGAASLLSPSAVVLAKGLSAGLTKHSALLVHHSLMPAARAIAALEHDSSIVSGAAVLACLEAEPPTIVKARVRRLEQRVRTLGALRTDTLLPVRGTGFSYEFELRATAELTPEWAASLVATCCLIYLLWWRGVLLLPRPLRRPRRYHAELSLGVNEAQLLQLFEALDATALLAARLALLLTPLTFLGRVLAARQTGAVAATKRPAPLATPPITPPPVTFSPAATLRPLPHERLLQEMAPLPSYWRACGSVLLPTNPSPPTSLAFDAFAAIHARGGDDDALEAAAATSIEAGCVLDCGGSSGVLGHHPPLIAAALCEFVAQRIPAFPFGLFFMKPLAKVLCDALAAAAEHAVFQAPVTARPIPLRTRGSKSFTARLMLSGTDANEAALRLCLVRWQARNPLPRMAVPTLLIVGTGWHGTTWLLSGLPTLRVRLERLDSLENRGGGGGARGSGSGGSASALRARLSGLCTVGCDGQRRCACAAVLFEMASGENFTAVAASLRAACDEFGTILIADETRCGLGQCGMLLPSLALGQRPHVVTLGEQLGGGYASVAAVLWETAIFGKLALPFPSTATLCNDNLSSHVGLATLSVLCDAVPRLQRGAATFSHAVHDVLASPACFDLLGSGLLLCVRLHSEAEERLSRAARSDAAAWPACLLLYAYLLRHHRLRCRPSGSSTRDILIEPSCVALATTAKHVGAALRALDARLSSDAGCVEVHHCARPSSLPE